MDWFGELVYVPLWAVFVTLVVAGLGLERLVVDVVRAIGRRARRAPKPPSPIVKP